MRFETRKMWVSTAIRGWPKDMFRTTLALLRPTPGSFSSASIEGGTSPPMLLDEAARKGDYVSGLGVEEIDGPDVLAHTVFAERQHLLRRVGEREQLARRLVDAGVGRLGREHDRHEQRVGVDVLKLALRLRVRGLEAAEDLDECRPVDRLRAARRQRAGFAAAVSGRASFAVGFAGL